MTTRYRGDLTVMLGPPAHPEQRAAFDAYQLAIRDQDQDGIDFYRDLERRYLDSLFESSSDQTSVFDELLSEALGKQVHVRSWSVVLGFVRGQWVSGLQLTGESVLFAEGEAGEFPPSRDETDTLSCMLGYVLKRDWVLASAARVCDEDDTDLGDAA